MVFSERSRVFISFLLLHSWFRCVIPKISSSWVVWDLRRSYTLDKWPIHRVASQGDSQWVTLTGHYVSVPSSASGLGLWMKHILCVQVSVRLSLQADKTRPLMSEKEIGNQVLQNPDNKINWPEFGVYVLWQTHWGASCADGCLKSLLPGRLMHFAKSETGKEKRSGRTWQNLQNTRWKAPPVESRARNLSDHLATVQSRALILATAGTLSPQNELRQRGADTGSGRWRLSSGRELLSRCSPPRRNLLEVFPRWRQVSGRLAAD